MAFDFRKHSMRKFVSSPYKLIVLEGGKSISSKSYHSGQYFLEARSTHHGSQDRGLPGARMWSEAAGSMGN